MNRSVYARTTRGIVWLLVVLGCVALRSAETVDDTKTRPYQNGPLTAEDFAGKPDETSSYWAWTQTEFRYRYNYRFQTAGGETVVTLSEIELWAVINRELSWNRHPRNALLLDHEQGHFDITQTYALEAQAALRKRIKSGPALQARATTKEAAVKLLLQRLDAAKEPYITDSLTAQRQYDKDTTNGKDARAQAEVRREQKRRLEALIDTGELAP